MNAEPQTVKIREEKIFLGGWGGGQTNIRGSHLVVHSVAFPACVKHISRQGVICSL